MSKNQDAAKVMTRREGKTLLQMAGNMTVFGG
jgi:hypothetical protein